MKIWFCLFLLILGCVRKNDSASEELNRLPLVDSQAKFLHDNQEAWFQRLESISKAKKSIDVQYFIIFKDAFGFAFLGALYQKATQGVKVRLNLDVRGTLELTTSGLGRDYLRALAAVGVDVRVYNPAAPILATFSGNPLKSNHKKIMIFDGESTLIGGRNIADEYFLEEIDFPRGFLDADVIVKSAAVAKQAKEAFEDEFKISSRVEPGKCESCVETMNIALSVVMKRHQGEPLSSVEKATFPKVATWKDVYLNKEKNIENGFFDVKSTFHYNSPDNPVDVDGINKALIKLFLGAKREILIVNPYVVLPEEWVRLLVLTAKKGVKIKLLTNGNLSNDNFLTQAVFNYEWEEIAKQSENLHFYAMKGPRNLHAKVFVFDEKIAVIGSYNLDYISFNTNGESVSVIHGEEFARQVVKAYEELIPRYWLQLRTSDHPDGFFGPDDFPGVSPAMRQMIKGLYYGGVRNLKRRL